MAYRVHVTLKSENRRENDIVGDESEFNVLCSDYVIRCDFLMLKNPDVILRDDTSTYDVLYINHTDIRDFTVSYEELK